MTLRRPPAVTRVALLLTVVLLASASGCVAVTEREAGDPGVRSGAGGLESPVPEPGCDHTEPPPATDQLLRGRLGRSDEGYDPAGQVQAGTPSSGLAARLVQVCANGAWLASVGSDPEADVSLFPGGRR